MPRRKKEQPTFTRLGNLRRLQAQSQEKKIAMIASKVYDRKEELDFVDFIRAPTSVSTVGDIRALSNSIGSGTGPSTRAGDEITLQSLSLRMAVYQPTSGAVPTQDQGMVRIILFRYMLDAVPILADILQTSNPLSPLNRDRSKFIQVIMDKTIGYQTIADGEHDRPVFIKKYFNLKGKAVWKTGLTTVDKGHLYILAVSDEVGSPFPQWEWECRLKYRR